MIYFVIDAKNKKSDRDYNLYECDISFEKRMAQFRLIEKIIELLKMSSKLLNSENWFMAGLDTFALFERSGYIAQCRRDICSYF